MAEILETRCAALVSTEDVRAKGCAVVQWCELAIAYAKQHGTRPWQYLRIPKDTVAVSATLDGLTSTFEFRQQRRR